METREEIEDGNHLCKLSIDNLIVLLAVDHNKMFKHSCSTNKDDLPLEASLLSSISAGDNCLCYLSSVTKLLCIVSHRPINGMCLSCEQVCCGQMLHIIKSCMSRPHGNQNRF